MRTLVVLVALASTVAMAKPGKPDLTLRLKDKLIPLQEACFPSGLRVLLQEDNSHPVVTITTVFEGGFADDPDGGSGTAHLAEHLWFRAATGDTTVDARLHQLGASFNAWTSEDTTVFRTVAPADAFVPLLELEAARMLAPSAGLTDDVVAVERGVVASEASLGWRPVQEVVRSRLNSRLLGPDDPRSRTTHQDLDALDLAAVDAWMADRYRPNRATMVVVGAVPVDKMWWRVQTVLPDGVLQDPENPAAFKGSCLPRTPNRTRPGDPDPTELEPIISNIDRPVLLAAWAVPPVQGTQRYQFQIAARWLGWAASPDAFDIDCHLQDGLRSSTVMCTAEVRGPGEAGRARRMLGAAAQQLSNPLQAQAFAKGFEKIYALELTSVFESMDNMGRVSDGVGIAAALHLHQTASVTRVKDSMDALNSIQPNALPELYSTWLAPERMVTQLVLAADPDSFTEHVEKGEGGEAAVLAAAASRRPDAGTADEAAMARVMTLPDLAGVQDRGLPNGLRLVVVPAENTGRVYVSLVLPGGSSAEPTAGLDDLTWWTTDHFYTQGTYVSALVPSRFFGQWRLRRTSNGSVLGVTGSAGNLDGALFALRDMLDHSAVDGTARRRAVALLEAHRGLTDPADKLIAAHQRALRPGGAPGGVLDAPAMEAASKLKAKDLRTWHRRGLQPAGATLLVVGDVDAAAAAELASSWFADWTPSAPMARATPKASQLATPAPTIRVSAQPSRTTTGVLASCAVTADPLAARVAAEHIEDGAETLLRQTLGVSYGVYGWASPAGDQAELSWSTSIRGGSAGDAIDALRATLAAAAGSTPDVRRDRLAVAMDMGDSWRGRDAVASRLQDQLLKGDGLDEVSGWPAALAGVDGARVSELAKQCAATLQIAAIGPSASISAIEPGGAALEDLSAK